MSDESLNTSADYFADSSTETVKASVLGKSRKRSSSEYPDEPPPPLIDEQMERSLLAVGDVSELVNNIVDGAPVELHCPFCLVEFELPALLKEHVRDAHAREVQFVHRARPGELDFYECPYCAAKFAASALLPQHILRKHDLIVLNMFSGFSPEKYVYCRFCPHKSLRKHYKLLMIHIEKKHFPQFERFVLAKYCNLSKSLDNLVDDLPRRPILKARTAYPLSDSELPKRADSPKQHATIRFQLPTDSPDDKENRPAKKRKLPCLKTSQKKAKVDPAPARFPPEQFKCGLCPESFHLNDQLIGHLKAKHKGLTWRAQYRCGLCPSKFYRNHCLVRHCWRHHAPLCLKTPATKRTNFE